MQRNRLLIILAVVLAIVVMAVAGFLLLSGGSGTSSTETPPEGTTPKGEPSPIPLVQVIVALQPIARGSNFTQGSIGRRDWIQQQLPPDVIVDEVETIGKVAKTDLVQGQLILRSMLSDPGASGEASLQIPPGKVAVAYPINRQSSVAFAIQKGDTVDILITAFFLDVDEEFQTELPNKVGFIIPKQEFQQDVGSILSGVELLDGGDQGRTDIYGQGEQAITAIVHGRNSQIPRRVAQLTVPAAKVIQVGSWLPDPTPAPAAAPAEGQKQQQVPPTPTPNVPDIVTLAVTPQDALVLLWLRQSNISSEMALRAANEENADHLTEAVTLQYMLTRFNIAVPPKIDIIMAPEAPKLEQLLSTMQQLKLQPTDLDNEIKRRERPEGAKK